MSLELAVIIAVISVIVFCLVIGNDMLKKPQMPLKSTWFKGFQLGDVGFFFVLLSFVCVVALLAILNHMTAATAYADIVTALYVTSVYVCILAIGFYGLFYIIFRSVMALQESVTKQRGRR